MSISTEIWLPVLFFFIALLYSSIGFGGGSSYLAILSLFLTEFYLIRSTALVLNIAVVSLGVIMFVRHRIFDWKAFWPFIIASVPLAYVGTQLRLAERTFFLTLGVILILSGIFLFIKMIQLRPSPTPLSFLKKTAMGGAVGFLAGLSGIGGGIFLSPILNLMSWENTKKVAALASVFILANSLAGLIGLSVAGTLAIDWEMIFPLILSVLLGGLVGSYLSNVKLNVSMVGIFTAILVAYVGLRLVLHHGFDWRI